jgi:AraC family transcriptional regulator
MLAAPAANACSVLLLWSDLAQWLGIMGSLASPTTGIPLVAFAPPSIARHQIAVWGGIQADNVAVVRHDPFDYEFKASSRHLLIASERAERYDGETIVDGLPRSHRRAWNGRMTFIPAGYRFYGWQKPRALARVTFLYIDPLSALLHPDLRFVETEFRPRLFFFDRDLWETALKLKAQVEQSYPGQRAYVEALSIALAHELVRMNEGDSPLGSGLRGGLSGWQQRQLARYIDEHLAEEISLLSLAHLAQLSPYHFSRAFKQSFGLPPHRYLTSRRIERAKILLAERKLSVTEIGLEVGFCETSSFTAAFRKLTGETPTDYRRSLA